MKLIQKIKEKMNQPVTGSILLKFIISINIVVLAYCIILADIRTTEDEETQNYINSLEEAIERDEEYLDILIDYVNYLK